MRKRLRGRQRQGFFGLSPIQKCPQMMSINLRVCGGLLAPPLYHHRYVRQQLHYTITHAVEPSWETSSGSSTSRRGGGGWRLLTQLLRQRTGRCCCRPGCPRLPLPQQQQENRKEGGRSWGGTRKTGMYAPGRVGRPPGVDDRARSGLVHMEKQKFRPYLIWFPSFRCWKSCLLWFLSPLSLRKDFCTLDPALSFSPQSVSLSRFLRPHPTAQKEGKERERERKGSERERESMRRPRRLVRRPRHLAAVRPSGRAAAAAAAAAAVIQLVVQLTLLLYYLRC